ncbi:hypothetical protein H2198_006517 [Neophaeococcomyces mojaviensis]|uniref:Uncharacterized protein n=1 Tax=Neophaeococcomyces mojaviensis TaxID=3383035 RepID=A0ACC3A2V5_9EURO|nr:hypothetical protein H2198_006517 [Knufia sp. JES_112]
MDLQQHDRSLIYVIGAGKGTLCSMLASRWGWAHISVGHELRRYTQQCDQEDDTISQSVRSATLVPVRQLAEVLARRMQSLWDEGHVSFIIDGFPRHESQISYIQDTIGVPNQVVLLDCAKDIAKERVLRRNDTTRTENEEIFERRFAEYCTNNPDIIARFEAEGKLTRVDTKYAEEVSFAHLLAALEGPDSVLGKDRTEASP